MQFHKFSSIDGFIAFDLDDAPAAGITRAARKVLRDGAVLLARDTTYAFASFGIQRGGGSAGINADDDARDTAVSAFVEEAKPLVADGRWSTDPGLGVRTQDLSDLYALDPRPAELWSTDLGVDLTAAGALAAASGALGSNLNSKTAAVVGSGPVADATRSALAAAGARVVDGALDASAEVLFVVAKTGAVDHDAAASLQAGVIVPLSPAPLTARAHALATRDGRIHIPSFLSTAAPLLAGFDPDGDDAVDRIQAVTAELASAGGDVWMAAAERAETYLGTWCENIPTFRPLA